MSAATQEGVAKGIEGPLVSLKGISWKPRKRQINSDRVNNCQNAPNEKATQLRTHCPGLPLGDRGTPRLSVPYRLAHAGHSQWGSSRKCDDDPYLDRTPHPTIDRSSVCLAFVASCCAGRFTAALAARWFGGFALAALCAGFCHHDNGLALRIVSWLAYIVFFRGAAADADQFGR